MSAASPREEHYQQWVDELLERIATLELSRCETCLENEAWLAAQLQVEEIDPLSAESGHLG